MNIIPAGRHKKQRGAKRMQEFGYKPVQIWLDAAEACVLTDAAAQQSLPLATYVRNRALMAALGDLGISVVEWRKKSKK